MTGRALNLLRRDIHYRREAFSEGLHAAGLRVVDVLPDPRPGDALMIWNRYGGYDDQAQQFERAGAAVLVVENGYLGKAWRGGEWFALSLGQHAGAGRWNPGGPERWNRWDVEIAPWRRGAGETLVFGQRGIGAPDVRCPDGWAEAAARACGGRLRPHPGKQTPSVSLTDDLAAAAQCVTWNSGAALQALLAGVPVWCGWPRWIAAGAARPLEQFGKVEPARDDGARLDAFRRLAWAMWTLDEIRGGEPIARLLH